MAAEVIREGQALLLVRTSGGEAAVLLVCSVQLVSDLHGGQVGGMQRS
ncbi:hypothetical protein [Deinococcus hopiensis]|nr:hypothetical protein [Deinococcus hopiensis]